eukprot:Nitzschia sp. Nitz4//scaffold3_size479765//339526//340314//NITZ4_000141-RA/size479765-augustus-gene-1.614-mRNA-1//-1//CDS//3329550881//2977//frame0
MSVAPKALYSATAGAFHWMTAIPLIGCVGTVLKAQQAPKEEKGTWMYRHKSLGLLTGMIVLPRVGYRLLSSSSYNVKPLPGSSIEHILASATHYGLYAFMTIMPATGIAMGYFGGKGLPFFTTTIPGAKETNGAIAKQSFQIHKQLGVYGKYLIPAHVAGAFGHLFRGHTIFARVNPFAARP